MHTRREPRGRWLWLSLLPPVFGTWVPMAAGLRRREWRWTAFGALWLTLAVVGFAVVGESSERSAASNYGMGMMLLAWVGGAVTSLLVIRRSYKSRAGKPGYVRAPWPKPTARSREWSARYALLAYVCTFAITIALAAIVYFGFGVKMPVGAGVLMVDAVLLSALLPLRRRRGLSREDLGLRTAPAARSFGLVVLALVVYIAVAVLWVIVVRPHGAAHQIANIDHANTAGAVLAVLGAGVSAPIVEEIFFRGLLYRSLRNRMAIVPAALLGGALFGLVHITSYPLDTLPVKAAFGVIACLLYERTGSLLPGIALHWFVDASGIDLALSGNDQIVLLVSLALVLLMMVSAWRKSARGEALAAQTSGSVDVPVEVGMD